MKRALALTGVFVIGIDFKPTIDAGSRAEHTTVVADYDAFEGRMGTLVENSIHDTGFRRADNDLIAFGADWATRSQITMNMNGRCRNPTAGHVDYSVGRSVVGRSRAVARARESRSVGRSVGRAGGGVELGCQT